MTVKELIEILKTMPQSEDVYIRFDSDVCTSSVITCYHEKRDPDFDGDTTSWVIISENGEP